MYNFIHVALINALTNHSIILQLGTGWLTASVTVSADQVLKFKYASGYSYTGDLGLDDITVALSGGELPMSS